MLAAAVAGSADLILTLNVKDFPRNVLAEEGVARARGAQGHGAPAGAGDRRQRSEESREPGRPAIARGAHQG